MRSVLVAISILFSAAAFAQLSPVSWNFSAKKLGDKTYEVHFTAEIGGKYHLYAQKLEVEGPVPTTFTFTKNPLITLQGPVKEMGKKVTVNEKVWGPNAKVSYFEDKVDFVQVVKTKVSAPTSLKGNVEFMVCDDKQCLPPKTVDFDIKLAK